MATNHLEKNNHVYNGHFDLVGNQLFGSGTIQYPDGTRYTGDIMHDVPDGRGTMRWPDGTIYKGAFVFGLPHGKIGTLEKSTGQIFKGSFRDGVPHGDDIEMRFHQVEIYRGPFYRGEITPLNDPSKALAQRGSLGFVKLLLGEPGEPIYKRGYALGIMAAHLQERGPREVAHAVTAAYAAVFRDPESLREDENIDNLLHQIKEGNATLLPYGWKSHAILLELKRSKENPDTIDCHLYNSGEGLGTYHQRSARKPTHYQTKWTVRIPQRAMTKELLEKIVDYNKENESRLDAYDLFLLIPDAQHIPSEHGQAIWQRAQKGRNCTLECIFAYLKNNLSLQDYTHLRRRLFLDCLQAVKENSSLSPDDQDRFAKELNRKIGKREHQLTKLHQRSIQNS